MARYGLDRPFDYRRLQWSRWFRCESLHSLLCVPSKPGIFALAEEVMEIGTIQAVEKASKSHVETAALGCPERSSAPRNNSCHEHRSEGHDFSRAVTSAGNASALAAGVLLSGTDLRPDSPPPQTRLSPAEGQLAACWPSSNSPKMTTWPSSSTACSPASIPCAAPRLRTLLPPLRRHRRCKPAPQHLQRSQSMDALHRRKNHRHRRRLPSSLELNSVGRTPSSALCRRHQTQPSAGPLAVRSLTGRSSARSHLATPVPPRIIHCPHPLPLRLLTEGPRHRRKRRREERRFSAASEAQIVGL